MLFGEKRKDTKQGATFLQNEEYKRKKSLRNLGLVLTAESLAAKNHLRRVFKRPGLRRRPMGLILLSLLSLSKCDNLEAA